MKVTKTIISAVLGAAAGGTAGYFVGRELEKRDQAAIEAEEQNTPAIDISDTEAEGEAEAPADEKED